MEELIVELLRMLVMREVMKQDAPPVELQGHCGCGCGERVHDLDDMNDLDDGQPYIWN